MLKLVVPLGVGLIAERLWPSMPRKATFCRENHPGCPVMFVDGLLGLFAIGDTKLRTNAGTHAISK